jgi:hypothetical protein
MVMCAWQIAVHVAALGWMIQDAEARLLNIIWCLCSVVLRVSWGPVGRQGDSSTRDEGVCWFDALIVKLHAVIPGY